MAPKKSAPKKSRRAAAKGKTSSARKSKTSTATKWTGGAAGRSASASARKAVTVEDFVRCIRTLHDLGLVVPFVESANEAKLALTMDAAAFKQVKKSVNKLRQSAPSSGSTVLAKVSAAAPSPGHDPFDFGSHNPPGGLGSIAPHPGGDPFDF